MLPVAIMGVAVRIDEGRFLRLKNKFKRIQKSSWIVFRVFSNGIDRIISIFRGNRDFNIGMVVAKRPLFRVPGGRGGNDPVLPIAHFSKVVGGLFITEPFNTGKLFPEIFSPLCRLQRALALTEGWFGFAGQRFCLPRLAPLWHLLGLALKHRSRHGGCDQ